MRRMPESGAHAETSFYVTAPLVWPLVLGLRALGIDADAALARAGVDEASLKNPDTRVPAIRALAIMQAALEASGNQDLGLALSELYEPGVFTVLDYLAHSSSTLREAIERTCRYEGIHQNGVHTSLHVQGELAMIRQDVLLPFPIPRQVAENSLANMLMVGRKLTGKKLIPHEVWFRNAAPKDTRKLSEVFGTGLRFSKPHDALVFEREWLDLPLPHANPALSETLERHARELLGKLARGDSFSDRVRRQISASLPDGVFGVEEIAEALGTSSRTLQRRLREEGTSLKELLEELRVELSVRYLAEPSLGVEDVALMLGFSDSRAFRRAFKRWKGSSPTEHRRGARHDPHTS